MATLAIILNWNKLDLTIRCIESLRAQKKSTCDILVVDNHSARNPEKAIKKRYPGVKYIRTKINLGVAGGRNIGLAYAIKKNYSYILLFDNDAHAHNHMLYHLVNCMQKNEDCGIAGPKIYRDGEKNVVWRAGCLSWRANYLYSYYSIIKRTYNLLKIPIPLKLDVSRGDGHIDIGQFDEGRDIDFQIGCAQMLKVDLVRKIGLLDERFSPYGSEDIDYCERAKAAGWKIRYAPKAVCWHTIGTGPAANPERTFNNLKNIILLARKHLDKKSMFCLFIPDFFAIHLPLLFMDSVIKNSACTMSIYKALRWHAEHIKTKGLFLR